MTYTDPHMSNIHAGELEEYVAHCMICGDPVDYCQGHEHTDNVCVDCGEEGNLFGDVCYNCYEDRLAAAEFWDALNEQPMTLDDEFMRTRYDMETFDEWKVRTGAL